MFITTTPSNKYSARLWRFEKKNWSSFRDNWYAFNANHKANIVLLRQLEPTTRRNLINFIYYLILVISFFQHSFFLCCWTLWIMNICLACQRAIKDGFSIKQQQQQKKQHKHTQHRQYTMPFCAPALFYGNFLQFYVIKKFPFFFIPFLFCSFWLVMWILIWGFIFTETISVLLPYLPF